MGQFKVVTSNYSAEYGGAGAAVTNVDIKSGTNQFHGEAYEFDRNNAFDAPQMFVNKTPFRASLAIRGGTLSAGQRSGNGISLQHACQPTVRHHGQRQRASVR
ncbi:MAG: hypothetical protein ACRD3O_06920 [Terriglobia bacterium]